MDNFKRAYALCSENIKGLLKIFCYQLLLILMIFLMTLVLLVIPIVGWILLIPFILQVMPFSTAFTYNCYYKIFICHEEISFSEIIKYTLFSIRGKHLIYYYIYSIIMLVTVVFICILCFFSFLIFPGFSSFLVVICTLAIKYMYTYMIVCLFFDKPNRFNIAKYYIKDILIISAIFAICSMIPVIGTIGTWLLGVILPIKILLDIGA